MKAVAYIGAALLIIFGTLMVLGSSDVSGNTAWLIPGILLVVAGLVLVYFASRKPKPADVHNTTVKIDLPANVNVDALKCKSCGGTLTANDISMVAGAPMVTCPFCHTAYQLTEEPKW